MSRMFDSLTGLAVMNLVMRMEEMWSRKMAQKTRKAFPRSGPV